MLLLIDNYDSFTYNLVQSIEQLGARVEVVFSDQISVGGVASLAPDKIVELFEQQFSKDWPIFARIRVFVTPLLVGRLKLVNETTDQLH